MGVIGSRVGPEEGASDFRPGDCFGVEGEDETATKYNIHPKIAVNLHSATVS